jgi:hypothetical protein
MQEKYDVGGAARRPMPLRTRLCAGAALVAAASTLWSLPAQAFRFGSDDGSGISGNFDSTISFGVVTRLQSTDCKIIGNDTGLGGDTGTSARGCNNGTSNELSKTYNLTNGNGYANADFNYTNFDDGNLNYRKHDIVSAVLKGTHDLSARAPGGWSALVRAYWFKDFKVDDTERRSLNSQAEDYAVDDIVLLDAWIAKSFDVGGRQAKVKLGNQVISWGEDIFILGGVNQINALDLQKFHVPGTQIKEIFIPALMISGSLPLSDAANVEAYYQFKWNSFKFDPVGTFFSTADVVGKGKQPAYIPTSIVEDFFGVGACTTPTGRCGDPLVSGLDDATLIDTGLAVPYIGQQEPSKGGQYGLALRYRAESLDSDFGFYYQRYHDKLPFLGFTGNATGAVTGYFWAYGEDKDLWGASVSTKAGPVAVGAEISYRPEDSVGIDPTVPFGNIFGPYSVYVLGSQPGYVEEKKWQFHLTGFYTFAENDPLGSLVSATGAADGFILTEAAVTYYPNLDRSGRIPYYLPNYDIPDGTSWGYVFEMGLNFPNAFDSGIQVTPQIDWFHDVSGTSPNTIPFVEGRKALTLSLFFNYRDRWKGALQWAQFMGGGANNLVRDRDFLSASVSYSF